MNVTRKQAQSVLDAVIKRYNETINGFTIPADDESPEYFCEGLPEQDRPFLRQREGRKDWEIVWESGPDEWAYRFTMGGVNEEVADVMHHEFGLAAAEAGRRSTEEPVPVDEKLFVEPINSYSVGVYSA